MKVKLMYGLLKMNTVALSTVQDLLNYENENATGAEALKEIDTLVKTYGSSGYSIIRTVLVYVISIAMVCSGIGLAIHGNNISKRTEQKEGLGYKIAGALIGFAAVGIVILLETVGGGLFTGTTP